MFGFGNFYALFSYGLGDKTKRLSEFTEEYDCDRNVTWKETPQFSHDW